MDAAEVVTTTDLAPATDILAASGHAKPFTKLLSVDKGLEYLQGVTGDESQQRYSTLDQQTGRLLGDRPANQDLNPLRPQQTQQLMGVCDIAGNLREFEWLPFCDLGDQESASGIQDRGYTMIPDSDGDPHDQLLMVGGG